MTANLRVEPLPGFLPDHDVLSACLQPAPPLLIQARVVGVLDDRIDINADGRPLRAARAVSCLVEPAPGDLVLAAQSSGTTYILSVLSRDGLGDATLSIPDKAGVMTMKAQSIRLETTVRIDLAAPDVAMTARRVNIMTDVMTQVAKLAMMVGDSLRFLVRHQSSIAERIDVQAQSRTTSISAIDSERVGTRVTQAELSTLNSTITTIHAKEDLRLDAKRVTVG